MAGCEKVGNEVSDLYDSKLPLDQPEDWWHQLQGGMIAEQRPPPPGVGDPYPNLDLVPPRPTPTDAATRRKLLTDLAAQRDSARQVVAQEPIVWPVPGAPTPPQPASPPGSPAPAQPASVSPKPASSAAPAPVPAPPADSGNMTATLDAADAPAKSPPPPAAVTDPAPPAAFTAPPPRPASAPPLPAAPIPLLPTGAPPLPALGGVPEAASAPATPRPLPSASFVFARGSDVLPSTAEAALRRLASLRAGAAIAVLAGGDAASASPDAQAAALPLALRRVGAISATLIAAGVPPAALRSDAAALGRDGSARLVD